MGFVALIIIIPLILFLSYFFTSIFIYFECFPCRKKRRKRRLPPENEYDKPRGEFIFQASDIRNGPFINSYLQNLLETSPKIYFERMHREPYDPIKFGLLSRKIAIHHAKELKEFKKKYRILGQKDGKNYVVMRKEYKLKLMEEERKRELEERERIRQMRKMGPGFDPLEFLELKKKKKTPRKSKNRKYVAEKKKEKNGNELNVKNIITKQIQNNKDKRDVKDNDKTKGSKKIVVKEEIIYEASDSDSDSDSNSNSNSNSNSISISNSVISDDENENDISHEILCNFGYDYIGNEIRFVGACVDGNDKLTSDMKILLKYLHKKKISCRFNFEAPKDGNCQFRCIADQIFNRPDYHISIRSMCVEWLEHNPSFMLRNGSKIIQYINKTRESWGTFLHRMKKEGQWGSQLTLVGISEVLGCRIVIISTHGGGTIDEIMPTKHEVLEQKHLMKTAYICFLHEQQHYLSARKISPEL